MPGDLYIDDVTGHPMRVDPAEAHKFDPEDFIAPQEAQKVQQQINDRNYAEQATGGGLKLGALGALNTLGLGLPGYLTTKYYDQTGLTGEQNPARHLMRGAEQSESYKLGEAAGLGIGLLGPDELQAGFRGVGAVGGLAERLAGRVIPEATGLLGSAGRQFLTIGARGATEGALFNMANTMQDYAVRDKPLTAAALAASGTDGALFGGLVGGGIGGLGAVLGRGADRIGSSLLGKAAGAREGTVARRLGMSPTEFAEFEANPGGLKQAFTDTYSSLEKGGATLRSPTAKISSVLKSGAGDADKLRSDIVATLEREAAGSVPQTERIFSRFQTEIVDPVAGTADAQAAQKFVAKLSEEIHPAPVKEMGTTAGGVRVVKHVTESPAPTWTQLVKTRDQIATRAAGTGAEAGMYKQALNVLDSELSSAIKGSESVGASKGLSEQFAAATSQKSTLHAMADITGRKASAERLAHQPEFTPADLTRGAMVTALGHPVGAAGLVFGKAIARKADRVMSPILAEMAYKSMVGAKAGATVVNVSDRARNAIKSLFSGTAKGASYKYAQLAKDRPVDREAYEKNLAYVRQLISEQHRGNVTEWAGTYGSQIHPDLAQHIIQNYNTAAAYLQANIPPSKKAQNSASLRPLPKPKGLELKEYKFLRIQGAIRDPLGTLDKLADGSLSRDEARAIKDVYPPLHDIMVQAAIEETAAMKQAGKFLPVDKISALGVILDAPVDRILETDYISEVNQSFAVTEPSQEQPSQGQPKQVQTDLLTPTDKALYS